MFERVTLRVADLDASQEFYGTVLASLGLGLRRSTDGALACGEVTLAQDDDGRVTRGLHLAFVATSSAEVDAFWRAGVEAGHPSDGEPGPRPEYTPDYYGAFLLDPDGNSAEAVVFDPPCERGSVIDHLWIRVADLAATRRFWDAVAPVLGLRVSREYPTRFHLAAGERSFALVAGDRVTTNLQLTFAVPDPEAAAELVDPDGTVVEAVYSVET